jgi:TolB-like protein
VYWYRLTSRVLGLVSLGAVLLGDSSWGRGKMSYAAAPVRLAVMEFGVAAGGGADIDALGAGLQSMLTTDLANVSTLTLVERARLRDVTTELKLGRSRLIDPATAAKVGKVVGASHLLTGSVTVVGAKMRIDARLVEVSTGRVLLGENIDGQADVFFELEKALVRKLVDAVAVQVTPRERGAMARVQTADFGAFRKYSLGLKLFDDKKYDQALKALREATDRDADFNLARTTLSEYERLVAGLRREADRIEQDQSLQVERQLTQELAAEQKLIARLFEVAGRKGDGETRDRRLTALYILATYYDGRKFKMAEETDRFAWERTTDALYQRYLSESLAAFPRFPALINHFDVQGWWKFKLPEEATFDLDLARLAGELKDYGVRTGSNADDEHTRRFQKRGSLTMDREKNAGRLHLDFRAQADFEDRLDALLQKENPEYLRDHPESALFRAELRRSTLDIDGSTRLIVGLRGHKAEPKWLRELADLTEGNARIKGMLDRDGGNKLLREMVMMSLAREGRGAEKRLDRLDESLRSSFTSAGALTQGGARALTEAREFRGEHNASGWVVVGNHVVWNTVGEPWTGPRRDPLRADEIRYFSARPDERHPFTLLIVDGIPRRDLQARYQLEFGLPPADFKSDSPLNPDAPAAPGIDLGRPTVTFVFGVRDLRRQLRTDEQSASDRKLAPMSAFGVRLEPSRVQLVDLRRASYVHGQATGAVSVNALSSHALSRTSGGGPVDVAVRVEGKRVKVTVAGETTDLAIPRTEAGFYGLLIEQPGYVSVRQMDFGGLGGN